MRLSRRRLLELGLGASQLALLSRFAAPRRAWAGSGSGRPTKLLTIWLDGGCHWESFFAPFSSAGITKFIPAPTGGLIPWGYLPAQVENLDRSPVDLDAPGPRRRIRSPIFWNWDAPQDRTGKNPVSGDTQNYRPYGYAFADPTYKLYEKMAVLIGADQGTASHQSGIVASMSGVAGATFRAPAVQAVIANAMAARFPDRALGNVNLGGMLPVGLGLPAAANPTVLQSKDSIEPMLSDRRDGAWKGLRARHDIPDLGLDGSPGAGTVPATVVDEALFEAVRQSHGHSTRGTDQLLEQLYDNYKGASRTIARDLLSVLGSTAGWEKLKANPNYPPDWTACIGNADTCGQGAGVGPYDFALKLLKSELATSVSLRVTSIANFSFDTHAANGPQMHTNHLRIALESVARLCLEMDLTPSKSQPGRSLLDETLVYVYSDFGRTFPKHGSDHHPATCAILLGGGVTGNQMLGGYDETMDGSPLGVEVPIVEESGDRVSRTPRSQDIVATVIRAFGLQPGKDFFLPGGYGEFEGVVPA